MSTKICGMCCMPIPVNARKCPHCLHYQQRWVLAIYHPAFACFLAGLPVLASALLLGKTFERGEDFESHRGKVAIVESVIAFGESKLGDTVAVIGSITNGTGIAWKSVRLNVDFLDPTGTRTDVMQKEAYSLRLPPHTVSSFKVSIPREFPKEKYARHTITVVAANDAHDRWAM